MEKENYFPKSRKKYPIKKLTKEHYQSYKFYLKELRDNADEMVNNVEKMKLIFDEDLKFGERARINHIYLHVAELRYTITKLYSEVYKQREVDKEPKRIKRIKLDSSADPNEFDEDDDDEINYKIIDDEE